MKKIKNYFNQISRKNKLLVVTTLMTGAVVLGYTANSTLAYFTTYASAKGGVTIELGHNTRIKEEFKDWKKTIQIENTGDVDCYIRTKIIAASQFDITAEGSNWSLSSDGYWYYSQIVKPGEMTEAIVASIKVKKEVEASFNVVVVQECTPVVYDKDGNPCSSENADWSAAAQYEEKEAVE